MTSGDMQRDETLRTADSARCVIGITGGIACGKSQVGSFLSELGWSVVDTDELAHEAMEPGQPAYEAILATFGPEIVAPDGRINRPRLGEKVFANTEDRKRLNDIVHPVVRKAWHAWARDIRAGQGPGAVMIPLLYEVGADKDVDKVICVTASEATVMKRLRERGLSERQCRERIASQWPIEEKRRRADYVIENNGTKTELQRAVNQVAIAILRKEKERHG